MNKYARYECVKIDCKVFQKILETYRRWSSVEAQTS
jgi:hypothetical protein